MSYATLHALFAGKSAATSLFSPLTLQAAVLVSIAFSALIIIEAAVILIGDGVVRVEVGTARGCDWTQTTRP